QTYGDVRVIVIGDGENPPLSGIGDARLQVYNLPANRGAYFALQLALLASPYPWFAPFGADDWAEPDHLERLAAVAARTQAESISTGAVFTNSGEVHLGLYEVGLFARSRITAIGGYNPATVGEDG